MYLRVSRRLFTVYVQGFKCGCCVVVWRTTSLKFCFPKLGQNTGGKGMYCDPCRPVGMVPKGGDDPYNKPMSSSSFCAHFNTLLLRQDKVSMQRASYYFEPDLARLHCDRCQNCSTTCQGYQSSPMLHNARTCMHVQACSVHPVEYIGHLTPPHVEVLREAFGEA